MMDNETVDLGCLPNGAHLYRKPNGVGGFTYYSDEIGGGVAVWDTCLVAESTLLAALTCEHHRHHIQCLSDRGRELTPEMEIEQMAATGGSFIPPDISERKSNEDSST